MKLSRHARIEIVLVLGLALSSCNGSHFTDGQRDEIIDIADDSCAAAIADAPAIKDLIDRVERLEQGH